LDVGASLLDSLYWPDNDSRDGVIPHPIILGIHMHDATARFLPLEKAACLSGFLLRLGAEQTFIAQV